MIFIDGERNIADGGHKIQAVIDKFETPFLIGGA